MIFERKGYSFYISSEDIKRYTCLSDKQLNKSFENLYLLKYISKAVGKRSPNKPIYVELNERKFNTDEREDGEFFTCLPLKVLFLLKEGLLSTREVRFLYYIQSYINNSKTNRLFCFAGIDTKMIYELDMTKPTIIKVHKSLSQKKLLKIEKHKLATSWQYDRDGNLLYTRYNNHYYIRWENFDKLLQKNLSKESALS